MGKSERHNFVARWDAFLTIKNNGKTKIYRINILA